MARPLRIDNQGGWHHLMNRGAAHAVVFRDDTDRVEFGTLMSTTASAEMVRCSGVAFSRSRSRTTDICLPRPGMSTATPSTWLRTDVILSHFGGDRDAFHRFVRVDETNSKPAPDRRDLVAVLRAANLVVLELGLGDQGRGAVVARSVARCWADSWGTFDSSTLMQVLDVPSEGARRTARSRARRRQHVDEQFARAIDRSAQLCAAPSALRRGSDPWRHRAARAAS